MINKFVIIGRCQGQGRGRGRGRGRGHLLFRMETLGRILNWKGLKNC